MPDLSSALSSTVDAIVTGVPTGLGIYVAVIAIVRLFGQRSLAKLSSFDFPVTVAVGAIVGRTAMVHTSLAGGVVALVTLFVAQACFGWLRNRTLWFRPVVERRPVLLVSDGRIRPEGMREAHVAREDVMEKLRQAGVGSIDEVRAMVMERSGATSVITGRLDGALLEGVCGAEEVGEGGVPHGKHTRLGA